MNRPGPSPAAGEPDPVPALTNRGLGELFRVPADDWTALSRRVGSTERLEPVVEQVAQWLPGLPALLVACRAWRTGTFPAIIDAATGVRGYAGAAIAEFTEVRALLPAPGQEPPPQAASRVREALGDLAASTARLSGRFADLTGPVARFCDANQQVDAGIDAVRDRLGPQWSSVLPQTTAVRTAAGRVRGVWSALADDLAALTRGRVEVTCALVAGLQIDAAIAGWSALGDQADQFARSAPDQEAYLTGQWLGQAETGRRR